jgi:hypothetical protein
VDACKLQCNADENHPPIDNLYQCGNNSCFNECSN